VVWPITFESRLDSWTQLRNQARLLPAESALAAINTWWFASPWTGYHLHWDDQQDWPDPWQLLDDNIFCEVARGLGILYTITLLERADIHSADLVLTKAGHNLVLVDKSKYILNWDKSTIVNINPEAKIVKKLTQLQVSEKYR
jgi:hypothetical protein